jgi:DEAD/DEAH box helicase domain-containing protein
MDKIVLDIETSNTFADVGGERNLAALTVSLVGAYSYQDDRYHSFDEHHLGDFEPLLKRAGLVIGFAINRFDLPVLAKHYPMNLMALPRLDLLDEIELSIGRRVSLNTLAKTNLGVEKTHASGLEAPILYREGKLDELRDYCLQDVKLTKELYELAKRQGYLLVPDKFTDTLVQAKLSWEEADLRAATLF